MSKIVKARIVQVVCVLVAVAALFVIIAAHSPRAVLVLGPVMAVLGLIVGAAAGVIRQQRVIQREESSRFMREWHDATTPPWRR